MTWRRSSSGRTAATEQSVPLPEIVILIHGTGAADADPARPKWWESHSDYAKDLRERLGPDFDVGETKESAPFKWSGANSERDRRRAGRRLALRLASLEQQGRSYHLVGHSHGGSVIWHSLWQARGRFQKLDGLKSWTTVGTPFLEFAPVWTGITNFVAAFVAALFMIYPVLKLIAVADERHVVIFRDGSGAGISVTIALAVVLVLLFLCLLFASVQWFTRHFWQRLQRWSERSASERFAGRWLGVWHPEDEPIAGLNASLISPIEFVPRVASANSGWLWRALTAPYNRFIAPVTDEFVWILMMGRLQGSDLSGGVMIDAGTAPQALVPGWAAMPDGLVVDLSTSAGKQASQTFEALRRNLALMRAKGRGAEAFGQLSSAVSWSEILHTSYFDIPSIRDLIAAQVLSRSRRSEQAPGGGTPASMWIAQKPKAANPEWPKVFQPVLLSFAKIGVFGGIAALLFIAWNAAYDAYIAPHTKDGQIAILARNATMRETMAGRRNALLGDVLLQLEILGKLDEPVKVLERIGDLDTRAWAGQRLAHRYAGLGRFDLVEAIAAHALKVEWRFPKDAEALVYAHAMAGAYAKNKRPSDTFMTKAARSLRIIEASPEGRDHVWLVDEKGYAVYRYMAAALPALIHFNHEPSVQTAEKRVLAMLSSTWLEPKNLRDILKGPYFDCSSIEILARLVPAERPSKPATESIAACRDIEDASAPSPADPATPHLDQAQTQSCPTDAELDEHAPRVGGLHFRWSNSAARIAQLIERKCSEAVAALVRRHFPQPTKGYQPATPGPTLLKLARRLIGSDPESAKLIVKYDLPLDPAAFVARYLEDPADTRDLELLSKNDVNEIVCLSFCSEDELKAIAQQFRAEANRNEPATSEPVHDPDNRQPTDRATYALAAAIILEELGDRTAAAELAKQALDLVPRMRVADRRYRAAFLIGVFAWRVDKSLALEAYDQSSGLVFEADLAGERSTKRSVHHLLLARQYTGHFEYRKAREAAERASDRLTDIEGLGEGAAVIAGYRSMLAAGYVSSSTYFKDHRPRLVVFDPERK